MKAENKEQLFKTIQYAGFADINTKLLEKELDRGEEQPDFYTSLLYKSKGEERIANYTLHFGKSKTDSFYLNAFTAHGPDFSAKFFLNKGERNITSKESFNLFEGRAVYKERSNKDGVKYNAWIEIDFENSTPDKLKFRPYNDNYGYDLKAALKKVNSKGLYFPTTIDNVINSLKKGNDIEVFNADKSEKYFIEAQPRFKDVRLYDHKGDLLDFREFGKEVPKEEQTNSMRM